MIKSIALLKSTFFSSDCLFIDSYCLWQSAGRPGIFNMRDRAKWDAWKAVEGIGLKFMVVGYWFIFFDTIVSFFFFSGKSKEEAMSDYITKVKQLLEEAAASA